MTSAAFPRTNRDLALEMQSNLLSSSLKEKAWTMSDLARASGVPLYTISRAVNGQTLLQLKVAHALGKALGVNLRKELPLEKKAKLNDWPEGMQQEKLDDGRVRIRVNAAVEEGVELAIQALLKYEKPISTERLWMILDALYASPKSAAQDEK